MHAIGDAADTWERFANLLSPTSPFPKNTARIKLSGVFLPLLLTSFVVNGHYFIKLNLFLVGVAFFGQPLITKAAKRLNDKFPGWTKYLELRNSLLKGVPTNAQLTLILLRIGEHNKAPLPPPPRSDGIPPTKPIEVDAEDLPLDASHEQVKDAVHPDAEYLDAVQQEQADKNSGKSKHGSKAIAAIKGITRTTVTAVLGGDRLKAKVGSSNAKDRLGILPDPKVEPTSGPVGFKSRFKGNKGNAILDTSSINPSISFMDGKAKATDSPAFSVLIADIKEVQKAAGLGWKSKLIVGWSMDREVADGVRITDRFGNHYTITAVELQEELFNRLIAIGGQIWESW